MSSELCTYLGPYLECQNDTKTIQVPQHRCQKCAVRSEGVAFCSRCGGKIVEVLVDKSVPLIGWDARYVVIREHMAVAELQREDGIDRLIPNARPDAPREFRLRQGEMVLPVDRDSQTWELDWFLRTFKTEIEGLAALYGSTVVANWGLLRWYN